MAAVDRRGLTSGDTYMRSPYCGIYVHIPFCAKKCSYCDFLSFADCGAATQDAYVTALIREIKWKSEHILEHASARPSFPAGRNLVADSVFIGGGTPSFIEAKHIARLLDAIKSSMHIVAGAEISMEANPASITKENLEVWAAAGVNRLSIGAQSTSNETLRVLGRAHDRREVFRCFETARNSGFSNINMDLIFAVPGQSAPQWINTLSEIIALRPEHLSFYSLEIEKGTPIFEQCSRKTLFPVDESVDRRMYHEALTLLKAAGYHHYEISNASLPGFSCRHNLKYWSMDDYLGFGLGAHSFYAGRRSANIIRLDDYIEARDSSFEAASHKNTPYDDISEFMFLGLRKREGVSSLEFNHRFNLDLLDFYKDAIEKGVLNGLLEVYTKTPEGKTMVYAGARTQNVEPSTRIHKNISLPSPISLALTEKGIDFSNSVFLDFIKT
jgi:oxygen-independent coproporphyrinogen-3 oxidase